MAPKHKTVSVAGDVDMSKQSTKVLTLSERVKSSFLEEDLRSKYKPSVKL